MAVKKQLGRLTVRVPDPLRIRLNVYAAAKDVPIQECLKEALEEYLKKRGA